MASEWVEGTALGTFISGGQIVTPGPARVPADRVERFIERKLFKRGGASATREGTPADSGGAEAGGDDLERFTVTELKDMAKERKIEGYSTMNKAALIEAIGASK